MKVNAQSIPVLAAAIAGALTSVAVIEKTGMGPKQVAGAVRNLRNMGMISGDVDGFKVLKAGHKFMAEQSKAAAEGTEGVTETTNATPAVIKTVEGETEQRAHNKRSKIGKAVTLFKRHQHQGRKTVLSKFQSQLDMTAGGASTYYQLCRKELGITGRETAAA